MLTSNELTILNYLLLKQGANVFVSQVARDLMIGKSTASRALKRVSQFHFVSTHVQGKNQYYCISNDSKIPSHLRRAFNLMELDLALFDLRSITRKIILFGSCSLGIDSEESDIDLCVITDQKSEFYAKMNVVSLSRSIQWVVKTPSEYVQMVSNNDVFIKEILKGIVVWENDQYERI